MSRSLGFLAGLSLGLLRVSVALAEPSPADRATARSLASEGYQALQDKDYATAVDRFSRADAMVHAPTLMIDWARSLVGMGKLVEAQERYEQIVREGVDAKAPRSWHRALDDANAELAELKPRLAWLTISVVGSDKPRVTIDDVPVPVAAIGVRRAVNPGAMSVRVQADGFVPQVQNLQLAEGATSAVDFKLVAIAQVELDEKAPPPSPPAAKRVERTWMYASFAVGGAGLVVGSVTGLLWLNKHSQLGKVCHLPNNGCPAEERGDVSTFHTLSYVSPVSFAVGLAGAGAGLGLWLSGRSTTATGSGPSNSAESAQRAAVYPYVAPDGVGVVGRF